MPGLSDKFIDISDIYVAYRKAKIDVYYEKDQCLAIAFSDYEKSLGARLDALFQRLVSSEPDWFRDKDFVGTYSYLPKRLKSTTQSTNKQSVLGAFFSSDADNQWKSAKNAQESNQAEFRLIGIHPVDFHVVSALWVAKVGYIYDNLLSEHVYGSRIRGTKQLPSGSSPPPSRLALGTFRPYQGPYKRWRENGIRQIKTALEAGRGIVATTADLKNFYHEASGDYLLNETFIRQHKIELSLEQRTLTQQLLEALETWAKSTPEHRDQPRRGLPVGLSAPRVIANALLCNFDRIILKELDPIYYGRYVDDIFLALGNTRGMNSAEDLWTYLAERSKGIISQPSADERYRIDVSAYSLLSKLEFSSEKQKVFALKGNPGLVLLNSVAKTTRAHSSEWRMLPELPSEDDDLVSELIESSNQDGRPADGLRHADTVSVKRLALAIMIRNMEAIERDLPSHQWRKFREKFYALVIDFVLTVPGLFDYNQYIPRLFGLAVACRDYSWGRKLAQRLFRVFQLVENSTECDKEHALRARSHIGQSCLEAVLAALPSDNDILKRDRRPIEKIVDEILTLNPEGIVGEHHIAWLLFSGTVSIEYVRKIFLSDLARKPFRTCMTNPEAAHFENSLPESMMVSLDTVELLGLDKELFEDFLKGINALDEKGHAPTAFLFPTRPFTPAEISSLDNRVLRDFDRLARLTRLFGGMAVFGSETRRTETSEHQETISIANQNQSPRPRVALSCFQTEDASWAASVVGDPDPDWTRYLRLNRMINTALRSQERFDYLILPELSLPRLWFHSLSTKLADNGISLVAGLEYAHRRGNPGTNSDKSNPGPTVEYVENQVAASLITDIFGRKSNLIYIQHKARPALEEERDLHRIGGKRLWSPENTTRPVICHGDFRFALLICSELMNIEYRSSLRGRVDALFVVEWNKDTGLFSTLVESAAVDVHCFVVQSNNRKYGDCRIRAPYRKEYLRDLARVKGGDEDYIVISTLDIPALRAFQSNYRSPEGDLFKPTPDGFKIAPERRKTPKLKP